MSRDIAYEQRELAEAAAHERMVEQSPLADRKAGQRDFFEVIKHSPEIIAERIGWLLDGNYGMGPMLQARNTTSRMNRPAIFTQMIAVLDHGCPRRMAVEAWKKLSKAEQNKLQQIVETTIEEYEASQREG